MSGHIRDGAREEWSGKRAWVGTCEVPLHLRDFDLRIVDADLGSLREERPADINSWALASVPSVGLECKAEDGDLLVVDRVEHCIDNEGSKAHLLKVIHFQDLRPIVGNLIHLVLLAQVNEVQNVLLKAAPTKPRTSLEKLGSCGKKCTCMVRTTDGDDVTGARRTWPVSFFIGKSIKNAVTVCISPRARCRFFSVVLHIYVGAHVCA